LLLLSLLKQTLKASLFSATVATFIIQSYQLLSPDSGDEAITLFTQISQQLVNISNGTPLQNVTAKSNAPFKPTASAIRVNVLWFLSLALSLTCAVSATLIQQRARGYMRLSPSPCRRTLHKRSHIHASTLIGTKRFRMSRAVETITTLLHMSVFLFFAGLVEFLFPVNKIIAFCVLSYIRPSLSYIWH
jgi:Family of unknown function (DUF6535)